MLKHKIGLKLTLSVVLPVLAAFSVFAFYTIRAQSNSLLAEVERQANQLSEHLKSDTRLDMLKNDRERIHASIRRIGSQENIDRIRVFNKAGEIIYSSVEDDTGRMLDKNAESCFQCHAAGAPLEHLDMQDRTRNERAARTILKEWAQMLVTGLNEARAGSTPTISE